MEVFYKKPGALRRIAPKILAIALIFFALNLFKGQIREFFYYISAPIQRFFWQLGDQSSDAISSFFSVKNLKKEADDLRIQNHDLLQQVGVLQALKDENEMLRSALGLELQKDYKVFLSYAVGKDIAQEFLQIDKGAKNGIKANMPVITEQKVLVGKISEVHQNFSKVMLISDKKNSFDAAIQVKDISGVIKGRGRSEMIFDLISRDKDISNGDVITTSSIGGIFPPGLLVGTVESVEKNDIDPFQQVRVRPFFDISEIKSLFIITEF